MNTEEKTESKDYVAWLLLIACVASFIVTAKSRIAYLESSTIIAVIAGRVIGLMLFPLIFVFVFWVFARLFKTTFDYHLVYKAFFFFGLLGMIFSVMYPPNF